MKKKILTVLLSEVDKRIKMIKPVHVNNHVPGFFSSKA